LQLLLFFFFSVLLVNPNSYFYNQVNPVVHSSAFVLPVTALVTITVLNDGTMISIAYDHVNPDKKPQKWNLTEVMIISTLLGLVPCFGSLGLLYMGITSAQGLNGPFSSIMGTVCNAQGQCYITYGELLTAVYLKVSISDFLTVLSARCREHCFSRKLGKLLLAAFVFATSSASLLSAFWFLPSGGHSIPMQPLAWKVIGVVWVYSLVWWFIQDQCKLLAYWVIDVRRGNVTGVKAAARAVVTRARTRLMTILAFLVLFLDGFSTTVIAPILPVLLTVSGNNVAVIGALFAAKPLVQLSLSPIMKSVVDHRGPGTTLIVGTFFAIATSVGFALVGSNLALLFLLRILQGICATMMTVPALSVLAATNTGKDRSQYMVLAMQGVGAGALLGPVLGGAIAYSTMSTTLTGIEVPFALITFLYVLAFILELSLSRDGALPFGAHPTPPDDVRVELDTPPTGHETSALLPKDWAMQRRPPVSHSLRPFRAGAYRKYKDVKLSPTYEAPAEELTDKSSLLSVTPSSTSEDKEAALREYARQLYGTTDGKEEEGGVAAVVDDEDDISKMLSLDDNSGGCSELITDKYQMLCYFLVFYTTLVIGAVEPVIPLMLYTRFHSTYFINGLVLSALAVFYLWTSPMAVRLGNKIGRPLVMVFGLLLMIAGLVIVRLVPNVTIVGAGVALIGLGLGCIDAPAMLMMNQHARAAGKDPVGVFELQANAVLLGFSLGPIASTFMRTQALSYAYTLDVFAVMSALLIPMVIAVFTCTKSKTTGYDKIASIDE